MTAEIVILFVILIISMTPVIMIGIVQYRSEEPVGFWTGKKPPEKEQIIDVKAYNHKHGFMWILYGTGAILCFLCGIFIGYEIVAYLCMAEAIGGIFGMIVYHNKLDRMYYNKGDMR